MLALHRDAELQWNDRKDRCIIYVSQFTSFARTGRANEANSRRAAGHLDASLHWLNIEITRARRSRV